MQTIEEKQAERIKQSGLKTIDLEDYYPEGERISFDLKDYLYQGLVLREKDFRSAIDALDWTSYEGKHVAVFCSVDAIIPAWVYMLVTARLEPHAATINQGDLEALELELFRRSLTKLDLEKFRDKKIMVKGCGDKEVPPAVFAEFTRLLRPVVKSLMYGEPCSTVPVYKRK